MVTRNQENNGNKNMDHTLYQVLTQCDAYITSAWFKNEFVAKIHATFRDGKEEIIQPYHFTTDQSSVIRPEDDDEIIERMTNIPASKLQEKCNFSDMAMDELESLLKTAVEHSSYVYTRAEALVCAKDENNRPIHYFMFTKSELNKVNELVSESLGYEPSSVVVLTK